MFAELILSASLLGIDPRDVCVAAGMEEDQRDLYVRNAYAQVKPSRIADLCRAHHQYLADFWREARDASIVRGEEGWRRGWDE